MKAALADLGRGRLYLLGLLGALKALGLVLVAAGVASGLASLADHTDAWHAAVLLGTVGALVRAAAAFALQSAAARTGAQVAVRLRSRVLRRAVADGSGSIGATTTLATTGLDELESYHTVFLPALVGAATVPILVGARILFADWVSALIIVLTVPLIPVFMVLIGMHTRDSVAAAGSALARLSDHLVELARGLPVLVGLGRVREQTGALREISEDYRRTSMRTLRTAFLSALALELIATVSVAVVAVFVGLRLVSGSLGLEAGLLALVLAPECYAPLREIGAAFHASQTGLEARDRVQAALDATPAAPALERRPSPDGALTVRALTVRHAGRAEAAVMGLGFSASPGSIVSLEGPSGTGKTSVLQVIAGRGAALEESAAVSGTVLAPAALGWAPQHPSFSAATAHAELVRYGATHAAADDLLDRMGLGAAAGMDPAELSPGQQRRLAVARVLARVDAGAGLALFDEPTAHLDVEAAVRVRAAIAELPARGVVVVLAAHDPLLWELADQRVRVAGPAPATRSSPVTPTAPDDRRTVLAAPAVAAARPDRPAAPMPETRTVPSGEPVRGSGASALRELARFFRPVRGRLAAAVAVGSLAALFAAALTAVSGWLIVRAAEHPPILFLEVAIVGVRFFGIGRAALRYSERLLTHDTVFAAVTGLRVRLWQGLAAQGPAGRAQLTAANSLDRLIGDGDRVRDLAPRVVVPLLAGAVTAAGAVVAAWILWRPAGVLLLVTILVALVGGSVLAVAADRRASRQRDRDRSELLQRVAALLAARDDLAGNGVAGPVLEEVARLDADAVRSGRRAADALAWGSALVVAVCAASALAMIALSAPLTVHGPLPIPLAAVFVFIPLALIDPLLEAVAAAHRWPALAQVLRRTAGVLQAADAAQAEPPGAAVSGVDRIRLDDVAYRYPGAPADAVSGAAAQAGRGDWLVITGPSGSGKTTLLGVLLRYLRPTAGRYLVDDTDAAGLDPDAVRRRIAWCPQEGHLFDSTLRGNLMIARGRADAPDDAELTTALDRVGLGPLLRQLPRGLDTPLGAAGARLSGGQRQRVAVARTLLARSDAVLLDEPTAHLDEQAAAALLDDLRGALAERTAVLVTHHAVGIRPGDPRLTLGEEHTAPADVVPRS